MITLKDYLGFIFKEITDSRLALDYYVAEKAQEFAQNEIMKNFPVPRFRVPEMELNIPVLIAGAKYTSTLQFKMDEALFQQYIIGSLNQGIQTLKIRMQKSQNTNPGGGGLGPIKPPIRIDIIKPILIKPIGKSKDFGKTSIDLLKEFYQKLNDNPIKAFPENIVKVYCENLFFEAIKENNIDPQTIKPEHKIDELSDLFENQVLIKVKENTVIVSNELKNLLVNPETQLVKENSGEFSVFQIKAKVNEEGVFIHTVKDENGEKKIVEFE